MQLTPPGSACSIAVMRNQPVPPGSARGLHLCVSDIGWLLQEVKRD